MCTLERKIVSQLLFLICAVTLLGAEASAITLTELRQIVTDSRESVATARLVYIEKLDDNRPTADNEEAVFKYIFNNIQNHTLTKVDAILDYKTKKAKSVLTDLRDINALLKEHNLPAEQKMNVSMSSTLLHQNTYEMLFTDSSVLNGPPMMGLFVRPDPANYLFKLIYSGVIDKKLLSDDKNPTLTEIDSNGRALLRIELAVKGQNATKATVKIDCDPLLGYRFRRIQWHSDGQLIREIIADDYRDVNGILYPFLYIHRSFDKDGKILRERKYIFEDVQLGIDLSVSDFKIFVPAGTQLTEGILSMTTHKIEQDCYMGIDDALAVGASSIMEH